MRFFNDKIKATLYNKMLQEYFSVLEFGTIIQLVPLHSL